MTESEIIELIKNLEIPFWKEYDFWIFLVLAIGSLLASIKAFMEAREAKNAAKEAGKTVKIQTITIELSEIIQRLDRLDIEIDFSTARDLLNETNRRVRRLIAPFKEENDYKELTTSIITILKDAKNSLIQVRPIEDEELIVKNSVYYAVESDFAELSGQLAELMGKFEERTLNND